ncbi:Uncharacterised protein [uncultured archaeon]|nr:Uncharacterised protein [uncultured archaeon]
MRFRLAALACISAMLLLGCIGGNAPTPAPATPAPSPSATPGAGLECSTDSDCMATGCSGQLCANRSISTTCEYRREYACYRLTSCGCSGGKCVWGSNPDFAECLENATGAPRPA